MKISELPEKIRKKALKYQKKNWDYLSTDDLLYAFDWAETKEGSKFWDKWDTKEPLKDTIVKSVIEQFKQRSEVGIKKYNTTLDRTDLTRLEWLQHAQEEAMDLILYLEKLKQYDKE